MYIYFDLKIIIIDIVKTLSFGKEFTVGRKVCGKNRIILTTNIVANREVTCNQQYQLQ